MHMQGITAEVNGQRAIIITSDRPNWDVGLKVEMNVEVIPVPVHAYMVSRATNHREGRIVVIAERDWLIYDGSDERPEHDGEGVILTDWLEAIKIAKRVAVEDELPIFVMRSTADGFATLEQLDI